MRIDGGKDGQPIGERSLGLIHSALSAAINAALVWELIDRSPMLGVSKPRQRSREVNPPTVEQIAAADAAIKHPQWSCLFRLAIATGARRGELAALRRSDFRDDQLMIERAATLDGKLKAPKGDKPSLISVDPATLTRALGWRDECEKLAGQLDCAFDPDGFVFASEPEQRRKPIRLDSITAWWSKHRQTVPELTARPGDPPVRFHDLRHFHATYLLMSGEDLWTVSGRLGHASIDITARVYAHYIPGKDRSSADIIGRL